MQNLLIVASEAIHTETIQLALNAPQITISCVDSSQCLLERCATQRFELIIFLSIVPYFTSMNIIEQMRRELGERLPVIYVISHSHSKRTILTLLECGVSQYMTFPINLYRLRNKVFSLLLNS
ncbi:MAG: hypothetical protein SNI45_06935 [Rikenellaceae bacterium]